MTSSFIRWLRSGVLPLIILFVAALGVFFYVLSPFVLILLLVMGVTVGSFSYSITQRRRIDAMRMLEEERTALLDLATHQLGMPLATFRWWLEILRDRKDGSAGNAEAYDQLQLGVDRMDHIIRSLQDAARLQGEGMAYNATTIDPVAFAREVADSMKAAFDLKKQRVIVESVGDVPPVMIDHKLMTGVLSELLENARGYSPEGNDVTIRVARDRSMATIDVIDRGCGIPADQIPRMFQKFTRGKNSYANKPVGNGLGLYICKGITERGGGRLSVKSVEGKGTTVTLALPLA